MSKNFALTGVAGYIAPRHLEAILKTGNRLVACFDPHDSVGILDRYFPAANFFTEYERFDRHLEKRRKGPEAERVHYISICSPNYLHDAHIRCALRVGANAICEKPLVLNPWNLDAIATIEAETKCSVNVILQLRLLEQVKQLRSEIQSSQKRSSVVLTYITPRGKWYHRSWKGDITKSGGILSNIGIHFFDLLIHLFGAPQKRVLHVRTESRAAGFLELHRADVTWFLSVDGSDIPPREGAASPEAYRDLSIDGVSVNLSDGFGDLHLRSYQEILAGRGLGPEESRASIELVHHLRSECGLSGSTGEIHPHARKFLSTREA